MAYPTNIATPPNTNANPTNIAVPVRGTKYPNALVGGDVIFCIPQTTDAADGLTDEVFTEFTAPFAMRVRKVIWSAEEVTGTTTFDLYNSTQSLAIVNNVAVTDDSAGNETTITTPAVAEDDVIQLRLTTAASTGVCKGVVTWIYATQLEGTTDNPVGG